MFQLVTARNGKKRWLSGTEGLIRKMSLLCYRRFRPVSLIGEREVPCPMLIQRELESCVIQNVIIVIFHGMVLLEFRSHHVVWHGVFHMFFPPFSVFFTTKKKDGGQKPQQRSLMAVMAGKGWKWSGMPTPPTRRS